MQPYEIGLGPAHVYRGPVGEPIVAANLLTMADGTPSANFELIGALGADNYTEDGVMIRHPMTASLIRTLGSTFTRKVGITETGIQVEYTIMDMNPKEMQLSYGGDAQDDNEGDSIASAGGLDLIRVIPNINPIPTDYALLVCSRLSPFGEGAQYATAFHVFCAVQTSPAESAFHKGNPLAHKNTWEAVKVSGGSSEWLFVRPTS